MSRAAPAAAAGIAAGPDTAAGFAAGPVTAPGRPLRVLMIAPTPFFADRGCHVRIFEEVRILTELGHDVLVATYHHGRDVPFVKTVRSPRVPWFQKLAPGPSVHKLYVDWLLVGTSLRAARQFRPDIIHAHLHEGVFVGQFVRRQTRAPLIADFQGSLAGEMADHARSAFGKRLARAAMASPERWLTRVPDRIVVSSTRFAGEVRERFGSSDVAILADAVDTQRFRPGLASEALRRELGIPDGRVVVVYLGVLSAYQGVDHLLAAARIVHERRRDVHFLLMGYPDTDHYRRMATRLGITGHVTITGRIDYEHAPVYLGLGDIAVSGKLSTSEANGKLMNYMACGLPVAVFDSPVSREILGDHGVYATLGDSQSLARAIIDLLDDPVERRARGRALRERAVAEYSWKRAGERLVALYREVLERGKP